MINYRLPMVSTLSVLLIACGAGSPRENTATVPTAPTMGAATSDIAVPGSSAGSPSEPVTPSEASDTSMESETVTDSNTSTDTGTDTDTDTDTGTGTGTGTITLPVSCSASEDDIRLRMLELINTARAEARNCGSIAYTATAPLSWNTQLANAAKAHSEDMAQYNFFSHTGSDGSSVGDRATAAGFTWQRVGENIAAGQRTAESAVNGWLDSPGHCQNLMNPNFTQVSVACVEDSGSDYGRYWTNVLGTPF